MTDTARMLLVRHGESTWNEVRRWQGQADPPLTGRGEDQARRAAVGARALGPFGAVVTSTLQRAHRTGQLLAGELGVELAAPIEALAERAAGEWEGLTRVEIEDRYPGFLAAGRRPPGYEADAALLERATPAILDIAAAHRGRPVLVVSHGGVINALERAEGEEWVRLDNLEGRWFEVTAGSIRPVGDRVHLIDDHTSTDTDASYA